VVGGNERAHPESRFLTSAVTTARELRNLTPFRGEAYTPRKIAFKGAFMLKHTAVAVLACLLGIATLNAQNPRPRQPTLTPQNSGTTNLLIAVSPVNPRVVWASGINGTFVKTTDGGQTWHVGVVPGAEALQFRDVQAFSDRLAYLLSIGDNPTDFRIYKTTDGGATWTEQFENQNPSAFYDCFAFWSPNRGVAHSDSVNGVFPDLRTTNGATWQDISQNMPPALPGEASFASSGTCINTQGGQNAWIVTGGASVARTLVTRDDGDTWNAYDLPLVSNGSAGAFTVAFRSPHDGIVGGGDLDPGDPNNARTAVSHDGGQTWALTNAPPVTGAIFGLDYVNNGNGNGGIGQGNDGRAVVITADTGGAAWTPDEGTTWYAFQGVSGFWGVAFANAQAGWLVGRNGAIIKISF
jgi:photosystem II stability/assembly factor-like uncharacterized protein